MIAIILLFNITLRILERENYRAIEPRTVPAFKATLFIDIANENFISLYTSALAWLIMGRCNIVARCFPCVYGRDFIHQNENEWPSRGKIMNALLCAGSLPCTYSIYQIRLKRPFVFQTAIERRQQQQQQNVASCNKIRRPVKE